MLWFDWWVCFCKVATNLDVDSSSDAYVSQILSATTALAQGECDLAIRQLHDWLLVEFKLDLRVGAINSSSSTASLIELSKLRLGNAFPPACLLYESISNSTRIHPWPFLRPGDKTGSNILCAIDPGPLLEPRSSSSSLISAQTLLRASGAASSTTR